MAAAVLAGLVGGLPWALTHVIGWPLPDHLPSWTEIQAVLLGAMTTTFLLDFLACAIWLVWALFTLDVVRCAIDIVRDTRPANLSAATPGRRIAAGLVGAVLISILGNRVGLAQTGPSAATPGGSPTAVATAPPWQHLTEQDDKTARPATYSTPHRTVDQPRTATSAVALAPDPETGEHDSLWRIAERTLGDGNRWPEIFDLNKGKAQPNGGVFLKPSLIFPGEVFTLPAHANTPATPPAPPATSEPMPPPPTTTTPSTPTTQVPSTPQAPQPKQGPRPTQAPHITPAPQTSATPPPTQPTATGDPGFSWGTEVFVGLGLASAISTALVLARRRHRRRYRPGSGDRTDLPVAPVVYQLRLAHLRADHNTDIDPADVTEVDDEHAPPGPRPQRVSGPPVVAGGRDRGVGEYAPVLTVGVRDGREIALDLAATHGLGLIGAGAGAAARALLVTALTTTTDHPRGAARVVVLAEDLAVLRARRPIHTPPPAGLHVVADLDGALDTLEAETLVRAREGRPPHGGEWPPLMLVARTSARQRQRLQAVLDNGSTVGVTGLLLGQWPAGATAYVRADGTISTTSPGLGEPLRGIRLFRLGDDDTADLLGLLHHANFDTANPPGPGADTRDNQVPVTRHQAPAFPGHPVRQDNDAAQTCGEHTQAQAAKAPAGDVNLEILGSTPAPAPPPAPLPRLPRPTTAQARPNRAAAAAETHDDVVETGIPDVHRHDRSNDTADVDVAPLRISVLGPPRVWWCRRPTQAATDTEVTEREITAMFQPRVRELLVFLALHPDGASREALVAALWATSPPEKTTNAMNTGLTRLRRAVATATEGILSDVVLVGAGRYRLDPELVEVDYHRFAAAVAARRAAITDHERVNAYRHVVDSYTGPVADGLSTEWLETAREAIRRDAIDAVAALARALVDQDPQQTLDLLEVARAFDPHNELIYRDIMRLQERLGQLDAIPRTLTLLTTRLAEVDDRPTHQAVDLAQRLRRDHDPPGDPTRADRGHSRAG